MIRDQLLACTRKELADMARERGVSGWHGMRKDDLIRALLKVERRKSRTPAPTAATAKPTRAVHAPVQKAAARNTSGSPSPEERVESSKFDVGVPTRDLSVKIPKDLPTGYGKDRIVTLVRDPYWLHCYWELTHQAVQRAEAALGQEWHASRPILRLLDVTAGDTSSSAERVVRDIEIHGGCNNWYIDVSNPPRSYRVDIGYLSRTGRFYVLARSNVVTTPRPGISDVIDENWADLDARKADRIYAMSSGYDPGASSLEIKQLLDERLRRPLGSSAISSFGSGSLLPVGKTREFGFQVEAELIVYGTTEPNARVTLQGQPVSLRSDGSFTMLRCPTAGRSSRASRCLPTAPSSGRSCWRWSEIPSSLSR
ncbi:MAG: DUF4912 domain-containing protein [Gemmataceae bacterium]